MNKLEIARVFGDSDVTIALNENKRPCLFIGQNIINHVSRISLDTGEPFKLNVHFLRSVDMNTQLEVESSIRAISNKSWINIIFE